MRCLFYLFIFLPFAGCVSFEMPFDFTKKIKPETENKTLVTLPSYNQDHYRVLACNFSNEMIKHYAPQSTNFIINDGTEFSAYMKRALRLHGFGISNMPIEEEQRDNSKSQYITLRPEILKNDETYIVSGTHQKPSGFDKFYRLYRNDGKQLIPHSIWHHVNGSVKNE